MGDLRLDDGDVIDARAAQPCGERDARIASANDQDVGMAGVRRKCFHHRKLAEHVSAVLAALKITQTWSLQQQNAFIASGQRAIERD